MIVIEFCGTPGCGKTFISNILIDRIIEKGYKVCMIDGEEERRRQKKIYRKFLGFKKKYELNFSLKIRKERQVLKDYVRKNHVSKYSRFFSSILLYEVLSLKKIPENMFDVVIVKEGIVQSITSLSHGRIVGENEREIIKIIDKNIYNRYTTKLYFCDVNQDLNISRLINRKKSNDRFLSESPIQIKKDLNLKKKNIQYIYSNLKGPKKTILDTENAEKAVSVILEEIEEIICQ